MSSRSAAVHSHARARRSESSCSVQLARFGEHTRMGLWTAALSALSKKSRSQEVSVSGSVYDTLERFEECIVRQVWKRRRVFQTCWCALITLHVHSAGRLLARPPTPTHPAAETCPTAQRPLGLRVAAMARLALALLAARATGGAVRTAPATASRQGALDIRDSVVQHLCACELSDPVGRWRTAAENEEAHENYGEPLIQCEGL